MTFGRCGRVPVVRSGGAAAGLLTEGSNVASISPGPNGHKTIQFYAGEGRLRKRKSIRLGKVNKRLADEFKVKVEEIQAAQELGFPLGNETARWLAKLSDRLVDKLAAVGLVEPRSSMILGDFIDRYIADRTDAKPQTVFQLKVARDRLLQILDRNKPLRDITPADADRCLRQLKTQKHAHGEKEGYAPATIGHTLKRAKQFFRAAVRARLISESPFEGVKTPAETNPKRKHFITREVTGELLEACPPNGEWPLLVALSRFGGLRVPSEAHAIEWAGVNWERDRFWVPSPKTEHHQGKHGRWVPIFPELRPYLADAFDAAAEGAVYVVTHGRQRGGKVNLRTGLLRLISKAGLKPWPRLWQNMRASRETELAHSYPVHVVCDWIGNSARVAAAHYLQVTEDDFQKAAKGHSESAAKSAAKRCEKRCRKASHDSGRVSRQNAKSSENAEDLQEDAEAPGNLRDEMTTRPGFEPGQREPKNPGPSNLCRLEIPEKRPKYQNSWDFGPKNAACRLVAERPN
jgi:integrase